MSGTDHPAKPRTQEQFEARNLRRQDRRDAAERREQRGRDLAESMLVLGLDPGQPTTMQVVDTDVPAHVMDEDGARTWTIDLPPMSRYDAEAFLADDEDSDDEDAWPPVLSMTQAYNQFGEDGWHIERGGQSDPIDTSHAYLRVYDLARDVGLPSKVVLDMIRDLGEFTVSHSSRVATPIAHHITSTLETRKASTIDGIANLRRSLA
jgi:hypothetical protein